MAITIVATAGSASANSFVTEAEFIAYMATRLNVPNGTTTTGSAASETEKKAMIEATRELNLLPWQGERTDDTQVLALPRTYLPDPDATLADPALDYPYYASNVIPQRVKDATIELAMEFIKAGATDVAALDSALAVKREKTGPLETEFFSPGMRAQGLGRYPRVANLIAPLLEAAGTGGLEVVRT